MRSKLFAGSALAAVLTVAAVALATGFTKSPGGVQPAQAVARTAQPCCTEADCCPECILCCSLDGCCEECIQCCIDMGCDPLCCFPGLMAKAVPPAGKSSGTCDPSTGCCSK
jgi:hypothetical protein